MAQDVIRETRIVRDGERSEDVVEPNTLLARIVKMLGSLLLVLLTFRFVLMLLGANRGSAFVDLMYDLSRPFVAPFFGIFGSTPQIGTARFEIETLLAMAVYAFATWLVAYMITISNRQPE